MHSAALAVRRVLTGRFRWHRPSPSLAGLSRTGRAWMVSARKPERLLPIGVCALMGAAALLSALPSDGKAMGQRAQYQAQYGIGLDGRVVAGVDLLPGDQGGYPDTATFAPELVIANVLQNPPPTAQPRTEFAWYVVKNGDSLRSIAGRYGITLETLYSANKKALPEPESIKAGLRLLIPPIDGIVVTVKDGDSLVSLADKYGSTALKILDANPLASANLAVGQMLVIPVEAGDVPGSGGTRYAGGNMWWPVVGGNNYISQYFNSGHRALDIAAKYGSPIIAAAGGEVVYAGWRSTAQGGYVVWIKHTDGLYTTYNHMTSKRFVSKGQTVRAGQRIGSIGTSGITTGPHLHFEVWLGYPWALGNNSDAINPCRYLGAC